MTAVASSTNPTLPSLTTTENSTTHRPPSAPLQSHYHQLPQQLPPAAPTQPQLNYLACLKKRHTYNPKTTHRPYAYYYVFTSIRCSSFPFYSSAFISQQTRGAAASLHQNQYKCTTHNSNPHRAKFPEFSTFNHYSTITHLTKFIIYTIPCFEIQQI